MGLGDQVIGSGLAKGAAARGKKVAFGDGHRVIWDHNSPLIFRGNPNIAEPNVPYPTNQIEWIDYRKGHRGYNRQVGDRWAWNLDWRCTPGEMYFSPAEAALGARFGKGFVLMEPNVRLSSGAYMANKQWGTAKYDEVASRLAKAGYRIHQFKHKDTSHQLRDARLIVTSDYRQALSILANAALYIGLEGGLAHGAAALGIPGVVLFGGWIPALSMGYDLHTNLTGGTAPDDACGMLNPCEHCQQAMKRISVDEVMEAALAHLERRLSA